jgi:pantothenate kinase type III
MAAITGALQQVLQQCRDRGLQTPVCVITGGDAQVLLPLLPTLPEGSVHDAQWVLKGLAIIAGCDQ